MMQNIKILKLNYLGTNDLFIFQQPIAPHPSAIHIAADEEFNPPKETKRDHFTTLVFALKRMHSGPSCSSSATAL